MGNLLAKSRSLSGAKVKKRKPTTIKKAKHQTGLSNLKMDKLLDALPPGRRRSKAGNRYTETRRNRSDMPPGKV